MSQVIPDSWVNSKLEDVVDSIVGGGTPSKAVSSYFQGDIPWMSVKDMNKNELVDTVDHISQEAVENSSTNVIPAGTPIVATRMSLGKIVTASFDSAINQDLKALFVNLNVEKPYLVYWYRSIANLIESLGTGTTVKGIRLEILKGLEFPLPPLAEQKVIADKLDELLAQVESTKARLDAIPAILKSFRQSVLAAAVSGKLTEEWRGNASYLDSEHMEPWGWFGVPTSWDVQLYSELTDSRLGKMLDKGKNTGLPTNYLGNINVRWFDFELSNLQEILVSEKELLELKVQYNDVLICEGGEPGRCAIWKSRNNESIIYQKALHRARVDTKLLPEWLAYNLKNDADSLKLNQLFTGTTIKHLTGKALKRYPIRVPSTEEQAEIVRRVEELFAFADKVESQVNAAQLRVNNLTQSILAKAFRGELTADWRAANPELISGDNSASALLKRIKAEREALAKATQTAKTKPIKNANSRKNT